VTPGSPNVAAPVVAEAVPPVSARPPGAFRVCVDGVLDSRVQVRHLHGAVAISTTEDEATAADGRREGPGRPRRERIPGTRS
jgi:hypothetical protein